MTGRRSMVLVTATKNEVRNVPLVIAEIGAAVAELDTMGVDVDLLVVDDGSDDGTCELLLSEAALRGVRAVIVDGPRAGLSGAVVCGLRAALERDPDLIGLIDADGQHDAHQLPKLVAAFLADDSVEAVFGSRFLGGSEFQGVTRSRRALSHGARMSLRRAARMPIPSDPTTSFRVSSPDVVRSFLADVAVDRLDGYQFFNWFAVFTAARFRFVDVPIRFRPRLTGSSHLAWRDVRRSAVALPELSHRAREWRRRGIHHDGFPDYPTEYLDDLARIERYNQWIADVCAPFMRGRVAEVGAGTGTMTPLFRAVEGVTSLVSIEPDSERAERLRVAAKDMDDVEVVEGTLADAGSTFDTVLYCNSLEHIEAFLPELQLARASLADGGRLVIFGPGHEALYGEVDRVSGHWRRFSLRHLTADVRSQGFTIEAARYLDPLGALGYLASSRLRRTSALSPRALQVYESVVLPPSKALGALTGQRFGKNVLVVARPG
jgi:glycosyltransferase involved in cell wall biosynthesis